MVRGETERGVENQGAGTELGQTVASLVVEWGAQAERDRVQRASGDAKDP